jgi:ATP-binding cassette subfamily B protein
VSQDEYVFNNTLIENINIRKARDINKIREICECMLIDEITCKKKSGYNMLLEENASNISGGERQRVILARTFLKNSSIYILDETFSQINIEKERIILKNIFEKFKDKMIIVISHRFDNSDLYDDVYNLEEYGYSSISKKFSNT